MFPLISVIFCKSLFEKYRDVFYLFIIGCYTRSVLDAIFESNKKQQWVQIKEPGDDFSNNTFWSSKECSLQQSVKDIDNRSLKTRTELPKPRASPHISKKR